MNSPGVEFIGEISESEKSQFLGGAAALIFPISWPEPFGLVMIEAMACGTPVIAFAQGSVPEVIQHGVTGFIVQTVEEAASAVARLDTINRAAVAPLSSGASRSTSWRQTMKSLTRVFLRCEMMLSS